MNLYRHLKLTACLAVAWQVSTHAAAAPSAKPEVIVIERKSTATQVALGYGVLMDAARATLFIMDAKGHCEARKSIDGTLLWHSEALCKPIGLLDESLLVLQASDSMGLAQLQWLDAQTGAKRTTLQATLPADVLALILPQANQEFAISAKQNGEALIVHWHYAHRPLRGALMERPRSEGEGENPQLEYQRQGAFSATLNDERAVALDLQSTPVPAPWVYALETEQMLAGINGAQFRSSDGRNVLSSVAIADPEFGSRYTWSIFSSTGSKLGQIESLQSMTPFVVANTVMIMRAAPMNRRNQAGVIEISGERLIGFELKSGSTLFVIPIADSVFRGVLPP